MNIGDIMDSNMFVVESCKQAIDFLNDRLNESGRTLNSIAEESGNSIQTFSRISRYGDVPKLSNFLAFSKAIGYNTILIHNGLGVFFPANGEDVTVLSLMIFMSSFRKLRKPFIPLTSISQDTGIAHTTFMRAEKGKNIPRFNVFLSYANALGFSVALCPIDKKKLQR